MSFDGRIVAHLNLTPFGLLGSCISMSIAFHAKFALAVMCSLLRLISLSGVSEACVSVICLALLSSCVITAVCLTSRCLLTMFV